MYIYVFMYTYIYIYIYIIADRLVHEEKYTSVRRPIPSRKSPTKPPWYTLPLAYL